MTLRIVGSAWGALVVAAALAGPAGAITVDGGAVETSESENVYEAAESDPGIVCGWTSEIPLESARVGRGTDRSTALSWDEGDACASGEYRPSCKRVIVKVKQRSFLWLSLAFEWTVEKTWCWAYPRITSWAVYAYPTAMDRFMKYRGLVSRWDRYYTSCCFSSTSGHSSYRMAEFENCLPLKGCIGSWYPRVRIDVAVGGAWRIDKDV
jgi:hypothetical protein